MGDLIAARLKTEIEVETRDNKTREDMRTEMKIMQDDILRKWTGKARTLEGEIPTKTISTLQMESMTTTDGSGTSTHDKERKREHSEPGQTA